VSADLTANPEDGVCGLTVSEAEAGQKLLHFLARRMDAPPAVFHRWIRTGQVRVNGGRARAFDRLAARDLVRVPPFALADARVVTSAPAPVPELGAPHTPSAGIDILFENERVVICVKPAGLPAHAGTGHADSLVARLSARYAGSAFMPTPAHRLDKATSGLVLVAKSYAALRLAQESLGAAPAEGGIGKSYLAWVSGACPWQEPALLEDRLEKAGDENGFERVRVAETGTGRRALLTARCLHVRPDARPSALPALHVASLLRLTPHTGRTHQIRAQLAARGFPLIGDPKYGGPPCKQGLLLHAYGLDFAPEVAAGLGLAEERIICPPPWHGEWAVEGRICSQNSNWSCPGFAG
jgi:23S rRNA pseudouridine955/2504/2580 synthase